MKIDIKGSLNAGLGVFIEEAGHGEFDAVGLRTIDRCSEQGRERSDRLFWNLAILAKCVEGSVLELLAGGTSVSIQLRPEMNLTPSRISSRILGFWKRRGWVPAWVDMPGAGRGHKPRMPGSGSAAER